MKNRQETLIDIIKWYKWCLVNYPLRADSFLKDVIKDDNKENQTNITAEEVKKWMTLA